MCKKVEEREREREREREGRRKEGRARARERERRREGEGKGELLFIFVVVLNVRAYIVTDVLRLPIQTPHAESKRQQRTTTGDSAIQK